MAAPLPDNGTRVAVTGATGKTGIPLVRRLTRLGVPTVALVHRDDERSESLRSCGADVLCGDLDDAGALDELLRGASAAYLCLPPDPALLVRTQRFVKAAEGSRVRRVVNLSQLHVSELHESPLTQLHWKAERRLETGGFSVTHLRSTFFAEGYLILGAAAFRSAGPLTLPFGSQRLAPIACADLARVAAAILSEPDGPWESTYTPTGPSLLDHDAIAAALSSAIGRRVQYVDVPVDVWRAQAIAGGFPPFLADHFAATAADVRRGIFSRVTDVVQAITGIAPRSFDDCIAECARASPPAQGVHV